MALTAPAGRRLVMLAPPAEDVLLAAGLAAAAQVETWGTASFTPKLPLALLALATTVPVAWRRRVPVTALGIGLLGLLAVGGLWPTIEPIYQIMALLVMCYSVGAYAPFVTGLSSIVVVISVFFAGAVEDQLRGTGRHGPGDVSMIAFLVGGAWLTGRLVHRRSRQAAELQEEARRLERDREMREAAALGRERARIARELHDVIAHSVSVMVIQAGAAEQLLDSDPEQARDSLQSVQEVGRGTVVELRRMLGILREDDQELALSPPPGVARLPSLVDQIREAGLPVDLRVEGEPVPLTPGVDLSAYRIVQEALTNTLKHAQPARAHVLVRYTSLGLALEIVDDGSATHPPRVDGDGHGLIGMRERAAFYGGVLAAGPEPHGGYAVRARLPVQGGQE